MRALKGLAVFLAVALFAAFICIMFLPVDSFVADKSSKLKGYKVPTEYTDSLYRYYYNQLTDNEKDAYKTVYAAFVSDTDKEFPKQIVVPRLSDKELENVYTALSYDNPEFFFLGNRCSMTKIGSINYFIPQYLMDRDEYNRAWAEVSAAVQKVLAGIPSNATTEYAKELYLHDYIVQNCEYDEGTDTDVYTMYGTLVKGRANCEGYSRTMQYLLREIGIYNYLAVGGATGTPSETSGHMWNIVQVDGNLYNLDITWDDYSIDKVIDVPDNSVSHVYFNMSTKDISKNHTAEDNKLWAGCVADSFGYFRYTNTFISNYDGYAEHAMKNAIVAALNAGYTSVEFAFRDKSVYDAAFTSLIDKGSMYNIIVGANSQVAAGRRVEPTTVQYAMDETNLVLRFFFSK